MQKEKVLCIHKPDLPASWRRKTSIIPVDIDTFITTCSKAGFKFMDRQKAEKDISHKQIIPYIIIQTQNLEKTAIYNRQGSEKRLHDLWSAGIGGHINPCDSAGNANSFQTVLMAGMERELNEELEKRPDNEIPHFSGIISEDVTEVGKVHLGAVFRILTDHPEQFLPGPELFRFRWEKTRNLPRFNLELWSQLALKLISL
jgi:predicted NUDIX family phosphoesterase